MNLTTKFKKYANCEINGCKEIAKLEDRSGLLVCHSCSNELENEQGYCSAVAWIDYDIK